MQVPDGLLSPDAAYPTVHVDTARAELRSGDPAVEASVSEAIGRALRRVHSRPTIGQALLKVHIGEPKCATRLQPVFVASSMRFLRERGASGIVTGDTTVSYSGPRGHRQNPTGHVFVYRELARRHGWSPDGPSGAPFVVLDRPCAAVAGVFEFGCEEHHVEVEGVSRFRDFHLAGGFAAADFVINHAHLTLHGLAGLAGCVKGIAMGCASLRGKLRMHQSLLPHFDAERCVACGQCVESCPEDALELTDGEPCPTVEPELCIGCGECEAVCAPHKGAVTLHGEDITDWQRGEDTLPMRMVDYAIGLMNGRWDNTIHVLHMYTITERCDCLDVRQDPMIERDLGFLVGKNPFAIDRLAGQLLANALREEGRGIDTDFTSAQTSATYAEEAYGILPEPPLEREAVP